jgi:hypothetical protein
VTGKGWSVEEVGEKPGLEGWPHHPFNRLILAGNIDLNIFHILRFASIYTITGLI